MQTMKRARCCGQMLLGLLAPSLVGAAEAPWVDPATGMEFVQMAKGCFSMGVPNDAFAIDDVPIFAARVQRTEMPAHEVCLDEFWIGRHEVSERQWQQVMGPPARAVGENHPVTGMRWAEAVSFAQRLSGRADAPGLFRLPSEAEWEYACRAGRPAQVSVTPTDVLAPLAWFSYSYGVNSAERFKTVHPVGTRQANAAGIHDMLGNAWEWTQEPFQADAYRRHGRNNPRVEAEVGERVIRGGSFQSAPHFVRCEARGWQAADQAGTSVGLRLVLIRQGGQ